MREQSYVNMTYILIADSQAEFRQELVVQLERAGHQAAAVATVSEATKLLENEMPDLLATDGVLTDGSSTSLVQPTGRGSRHEGSRDDRKPRPDRRAGRSRATLFVEAGYAGSVRATGPANAWGRLKTAKGVVWRKFRGAAQA